MKKLNLFSLIVAALISACTNEPQMESSGDDPSAKALTTKAEQLITKAQQARALFYPSQSRSVSTDATIEYVVSRNSRSEADTLLSIVNFADNQGFVIITDKAEVPEILAVTDDGNLIPDLNDNPGLQQYLDNAEAALSTLPRRGPGGSTPLDPTRPFLFDTESVYDTISTIPPKVQVRWGQYAPYNRFCPIIDGVQAPAGCAPIAAAQTMTYFKHPLSFTWDVDGSQTTISLNWIEINKHIGNAKYGLPELCYDSEATHNTTGKLIRQIGENMDADYGKFSTGVRPSMVPPAIRTFGYTATDLRSFSNDDNYNGSSIWIFCGWTDGAEGHAYIVDGRCLIRGNHTEYIADPSTTPPTIVEIVRQYTTQADYLHVNWGWDGYSNGYFYYGSFNTSNPAIKDYPSVGTANYNFTENLMYTAVSR